MTTLTPQEPNDDRIIKWSSFYNPDSIKHITLEENLELRKVIIDLEKVFSQAEDHFTSPTHRQIIGDLTEFSRQVISALFILNKGKIASLRNILDETLKEQANDERL